MSKKLKGVAAGEKQHFLKGINEPIPEGTQTTGLKEAPAMSYEIDHVYGYAGDRNTSCLYFGQTNNEIVYMCAALGVV